MSITARVGVCPVRACCGCSAQPHGVQAAAFEDFEKNHSFSFPLKLLHGSSKKRRDHMVQGTWRLRESYEMHWATTAIHFMETVSIASSEPHLAGRGG